MINKNRIIQLILFFFTYSIIKDFFYKTNPEVYLLFRLLFFLGLLILTGFLSALFLDFKKCVQDSFSDKEKVKYRLMILLFWVLAVITIKNVGWVAENVSNSMIMFISFVPIIWLFKPGTVFISKIMLLLLLLTALFVNGYRLTAEIFAELTYLWLATSVIIKLKQNI